MRFGYDWFERFCMHFPVDYMAFVNIKRQIEKDEEIAEELQDRDQSYRRAED